MSSWTCSLPVQRLFLPGSLISLPCRFLVRTSKIYSLDPRLLHLPVDPQASIISKRSKYLHEKERKNTIYTVHTAAGTLDSLTSPPKDPHTDQQESISSHLKHQSQINSCSSMLVLLPFMLTFWEPLFIIVPVHDIHSNKKQPWNNKSAFNWFFIVVWVTCVQSSLSANMTLPT